VLGVDPGGMPSGLTRRGGFVLAVAGLILPLMAAISVRLSPNGAIRTTAKSAADVLRAAFDTESLGEQPRAVYLNGTEIGESSEEARDKTKQGMLWRDSVRYTGLRSEETALVAWE
jgi:hypothetical protein